MDPDPKTYSFLDDIGVVKIYSIQKNPRNLIQHSSSRT